MMKIILMLSRCQGIKQELNSKVTFIFNIVHLSIVFWLCKCKGFAVLHRLSLKLKPIFDIGFELLNHPMSHTARGCHSMSHRDSVERGAPTFAKLFDSHKSDTGPFFLVTACAQQSSLSLQNKRRSLQF